MHSCRSGCSSRLCCCAPALAAVAGRHRPAPHLLPALKVDLSNKDAEFVETYRSINPDPEAPAKVGPPAPPWAAPSPQGTYRAGLCA